MAAAAMVKSSREEYVYMAKLAEQAERYEEMVEFMEKATKGVEVEELTVEEPVIPQNRHLMWQVRSLILASMRCSSFMIHAGGRGGRDQDGEEEIKETSKRVRTGRNNSEM